MRHDCMQSLYTVLLENAKPFFPFLWEELKDRRKKSLTHRLHLSLDVWAAYFHTWDQESQTNPFKYNSLRKTIHCKWMLSAPSTDALLKIQ